MRKTPVLIAFMCFAAAATSHAQSNQKPGLWEMTSTMTWQKSPLPPGMSMPGGGNSPFGGGAHTMQVCLTKEMIDKYGTPPPQNRNNQCQVSNIVKKGNGMTGDWVCSGMMAGKGTVEASWTDPDHSTSKVHFIGSMQMGPNATPVEYTIESTSVFKGADCGSVKPLPMPKD
jgi:Protein of unknown function (DUF3617).